MTERAARIGRVDEQVPNPNAWLITFADLCTLLLSFFVLLFSMSSLNARAFRNTFQNLDKASGVLGFKAADLAAMHPYHLVREISRSLEELDQLTVADIDQMNAAQSIQDRDAQRMAAGKAIWSHKLENEAGFSFILGQQLLFDRGQTTVNPGAYPVLEKLAQFMKFDLYTVYIDGHTDDAPIHTVRFPSNEALSLARAEAVMEHLVVSCGVNPKLFALAGYGSSHPLMRAVTPAQKAANRRVELIFHRNPK
jgi:chemotaxis protein MotB